MAAGAGRLAALPGRFGAGLLHALLSAAAALVALGASHVIGMREGFWAAITAISVAQSELHAATSTGRDQLIGAGVGGIVAAAVALPLGTGLIQFALALLVAVTICWMLEIGSAARLAGITTVIVFLVPARGSLPSMVMSRVGEVATGALTALAIVWLASRAIASRAGAVVAEEGLEPPTRGL